MEGDKIILKNNEQPKTVKKKNALSHFHIVANLAADVIMWRRWEAVPTSAIRLEYALIT